MLSASMTNAFMLESSITRISTRRLEHWRGQRAQSLFDVWVAQERDGTRRQRQRQEKREKGKTEKQH